MKQIITISSAFVFMLMSTVLSAQISLKGGIGGHTSVIALNSSDFTTSNGFGTNFGAGVQFGQRFYFETGLQVFNSAQSIEPVRSIANPNVQSLNARIMGVHVPLIGGFYFKSANAPLNFQLFGGASLRTVAAARSGSDYQTRDFRFANVGALVGFGVTSGIFFGELAYEFGVTDVFKSELADFDSRHNFIRLTAGIHLFRNR
jgi:hypothetical protein